VTATVPRASPAPVRDEAEALSIRDAVAATQPAARAVHRAAPDAAVRSAVKQMASTREAATRAATAAVVRAVAVRGQRELSVLAHASAPERVASAMAVARPRPAAAAC